MKTLRLISFSAAVAALALFPLSLTIAGSLLFTAGVLTIMAGDYSRSLQPLTPRVAVVPFPHATNAARALEFAA